MRLTVAQALVRFLAAQRLERDGESQPFFAGCLGIFGHGNLSGIGQALSGVLYVVMAFLLYVPQMLIAAMAMNLGTKRASAAAVGLTGIIGYSSTIITGWGIGSLVDKHGWPAAFKLMLLCATITLVLMAFTWNVGAHPELVRAEAK